MAGLNNYIPDVNKFKLAGPPSYWLRRLFEFDPSLVVVPSRQGFYYRLAQRRKLSLPEKMVHDILKEDSDTAMLARYGLIPVTTILATANWQNPLMFQELADRAPWRQGGADAVNRRIEEQEREAEMKTQLVVEDIKDQVAKDGWKLYRKKIGLGRTFHSHGLSPRVS